MLIDFKFEDSESEPLKRNLRFDHSSAETLQAKDSTPEFIERAISLRHFVHSMGSNLMNKGIAHS